MHLYKGKQEVLPSVTYIIEKTKPLAEVIRMNKAIESKRKREGITEEDALTNRQLAADRGTVIHSFHEHYWKTGELQKDKWEMIIDQNINPCTNQFYTVGDFLKGFEQYLDDIKQTRQKVELIESETDVVSEKFQYGGRLDLLLNIDGKNHLFDLKTSNGYFHQYKQQMVYLLEKWRKPQKIEIITNNSQGKPIKEKTYEFFPPEPERDWTHVSHWVKDKYIQLAMYRMATIEYLNHKVDRVNLLILFPNGRYQLIVVPSKVYIGCQQEAIARIKQFWNTEGDKWKLLANEKLLLQN